MKARSLAIRMLVPVFSLAIGSSAHAALYDRGGGLIYDDVLNVTWLQNVTLAAGSIYDDDDPADKLENAPGYDVYSDGLLSYGSAMAWAATLEYYDAVRDVVWDDWRLPQVSPVNNTSFNLVRTLDGSSDVGYNITSPDHELSYMYYVNLGNIGQYDSLGNIQTGFGLVDDLADPSDESLFANLKTGLYWYSTVRPDNDTNAWDFRMRYGNTTAGHFGYVRYAWAVHPGDVAAIPEASTWMLLLAGLGLVGLATRRRMA
jgi:hypothetical protein